MFGPGPPQYQDPVSASTIYSHLPHCDNMAATAVTVTFPWNNVSKQEGERSFPFPYAPLSRKKVSAQPRPNSSLSSHWPGLNHTPMSMP